MSLQLCPAPLFLSSTPFCGPSTCTHLDRTSSSARPEKRTITTRSGMDSAGVVSLPLDLDGAAFGAAINKPSASPSPGAQSASIVTTASAYPPQPSSTSPMQMIRSDTPLGRETKRRIISRQSGVITGTSTDLGDAADQPSKNSANEYMSVNYSQSSDIGGQTRYVEMIFVHMRPSNIFSCVSAPCDIIACATEFADQLLVAPP